MSKEKLYVNTIGKTVEIKPFDSEGVRIPLLLISSPMVHLRKPNREEIEVPVVPDYEEDKYEMSLDGVIDLPGEYVGQLYISVLSSSWEGYGSSFKFTVFNKFE